MTKLLIYKIITQATNWIKNTVRAMNQKQKIVLGIGISLFAILVVYPPHEASTLSLGHKSIITPIPWPLQGGVEEALGALALSQVDWLRFLVETSLIAVLTGIWIMVFKYKVSKSD